MLRAHVGEDCVLPSLSPPNFVARTRWGAVAALLGVSVGWSHAEVTVCVARDGRNIRLSHRLLLMMELQVVVFVFYTRS